jgi:hypothetical protein
VNAASANWAGDVQFRGARSRDGVDELHGLIAWGPVEAALAAIPVAGAGRGRVAAAGALQGALDRRLARPVGRQARRGARGSGLLPALLRLLTVRTDARADGLRAVPSPARGAGTRPGAFQAGSLSKGCARSVTVKMGTLVDATVVASASQGDGEASWSGHRVRKAIHGYKAHVAADADTGMVECVDVTPGNVHEGRASGAVVPDDPALVHTLTAPIAGARLAEAERERGGATRIAPTSWCGR